MLRDSMKNNLNHLVSYPDVLKGGTDNQVKKSCALDKSRKHQPLPTIENLGYTLML